MVYEGRRGRHSRSRSRKKGSGGGFLILLWGLIIVVAAALVFPKAAGKVRDKLSAVIGVDIRGAVEVFSREVKGGGIFAATKEAFRYAFGQEDDRGVEVIAGDEDNDDAATPPNTDSPAVNEMTAEERFKESQKAYAALELPKSVIYELTRPELKLSEPVKGTVAKGFGYYGDAGAGAKFHYGLDIRADTGATVLSISDGSVTAVGDSTIFGKYVIVSHENGVQSLYSMLGETPLTEGQSVESGQSVGVLSGDILHLELVIDGNYVNPLYYVYQYEAQ